MSATQAWFPHEPTLEEWLEHNPAASDAERRRLMRQIADALNRYHRSAPDKRAAYGTLAPANIVVHADGTVSLAPSTASAMQAAFIAPELRGPDAVPTVEGDRYAFVVTAAQALSGRRPPVGTDGFLDLDALERKLLSTSGIRLRPFTTRQLIAALTAEPRRRPRRLHAWLERPTRALVWVPVAAVVVFIGVGAAVGKSGSGSPPQVPPTLVASGSASSSAGVEAVGGTRSAGPSSSASARASSGSTQATSGAGGPVGSTPGSSASRSSASSSYAVGTATAVSRSRSAPRSSAASTPSSSSSASSSASSSPSPTTTTPTTSPASSSPTSPSTP